MTTYELTTDQMNELKINYMMELADAGIFADILGKSYDYPSWGDIAFPDVPDDMIHKRYEGVAFTEDDFFCSAMEL